MSQHFFRAQKSATGGPARDNRNSIATERTSQPINRRRFLRNFAASVVAFVAIVAGEGALPAQITGEETATKPKWLNDQSVTPVSHCAGKWIWCEGAEADQRDVYVFVRGEVALDGGIKAARLHVSAEDRYLLYLNGNYLGRGPARSLPKLKSYDTYDVGARLKKGRNVIAIRAYHYGFGDLLSHGHNYASGARAGIWSQLEVQSDNGAMHRFGSGDTWKMRPAS